MIQFVLGWNHFDYGIKEEFRGREQAPERLEVAQRVDRRAGEEKVRGMFALAHIKESSFVFVCFVFLQY